MSKLVPDIYRERTSTRVRHLLREVILEDAKKAESVLGSKMKNKERKRICLRARV